MPLSREEQRVLDQMERALQAEDAQLGERIGRRSRRLGSGLGVAMVALGCGLVLLVVGILGASGLHIALAIIGFFTVTFACTAMAVIQEKRWFGRSCRRHVQPPA